jgi:RimJ/RimL family protein N-acetyltransferase
MNNTFETERLLLKPVDGNDGPFIYDLMSSDTWLNNIGYRNIDTVADADAYINSFHLPHWKENGCGSYIVIEKSTNTKIGLTGLFNRPGLDTVDVGFAYLEPFQNKGYGYEAASKVIDVATQNGFNCIVAITDKKNVPSQSLLKKIGTQILKASDFAQLQ